MTLITLAFRNALRDKTRTALTVGSVALAVLAFVSLRSVLTSWTLTADHADPNRLITANRNGFVFNMPKRYVDLIGRHPGVQSVASERTFDVRDPRNPNNGFISFAVSAESYLQVFPEIALPPQERAQWLADRQGALVGDLLARELGLRVGDRVTLEGNGYDGGEHPFHVSGVYTTSRDTVDRTLFLFHWAYLNERLPDWGRERVTRIHTVVADAADPGLVAASIDRLFVEKSIQTQTVTAAEFRLSFVQMAGAIGLVVEVISTLVLGLVAIILGNTVAMGVRERRSEHGVLRAIGFLPTHVRRLILGESLALGFLSGVLGVGLSYPILQLAMADWMVENLREGLGRSYFAVFEIRWQTAVQALVLASVLGLMAGAVPAFTATRSRVTDALRAVD